MGRKAWVASSIEQVPTRLLVPYARNARTHSDEQVQEIAASIRRFGWTTPALIDEAGTIIAGHGRVLAAQSLRMRTVPCIRISHLDDGERRALTLADNRIALNAGWDEAMLEAELADLHATGVDIDGLGFSDDELAAITGAVIEDVTDEPEPEPPDVTEPCVSRAGEMYELGPHRLLVGDSTSAVHVSRALDLPPFLMLFDPPYDLDFGLWHLPESVQVVCVWHRCKSGMQWIMDRCGGEEWGYHAVLFTGGVRGQHNHTLPACMHDQVHVLRRRWWMDKMEALDRGVLERCGAKVCTDGRHYSWQEGHGGVLTTVSHGMSWGKPPFESEVMLAYTPPGAVVWDPVAGSGSTLLATAKHGRIWRGMELQPRWADLIRQRWGRFARENDLEVGDGLA